ncbi:lytic transglycosylase domain-containing protein [Variovorax sp. RCC_210]|uniref:lytic transglycosylase domain-containing protein n=1 Tax=Variovorax sp. RCC_210 TaxID=3239217 RepID=UPI003525163A
MVDSLGLLEQCAPQVPTHLMHALVRVESAWRPLAIGMDAREGRVPQPRTLTQAVAQAKALASAGRGFSVGLAQIHVGNVSRFGMAWEQAFDPCLNLEAGQRVLRGFYGVATARGYAGQAAVEAALRGYNAGAIDRVAGDGYAKRVVGYAQGRLQPTVKAGGPASEFPTPASPRIRPEALRGSADPLVPPGSQNEAEDVFARRAVVPGF